MRNRFSLLGGCILLLALLLALFTSPRSGSGYSLVVYLVAPLAAVAVSLLSLRRKENPVFTMSVFSVAIIYLGLLLFGVFSFFDLSSLAPLSCVSSAPVRCDGASVSTSGGTSIVLTLVNAEQTPLDLRYAVAVASLAETADPGVCTLPVELVVQPGESFTLACSFSGAQPLSPPLSGTFGLSFADNTGAPVRALGSFKAN